MIILALINVISLIILLAFLEVKGTVGNVFDKKKIHILTYGINHYIPSKKNSIHAEHDAINKLPYIKKKSKLKKINILIVRMSKHEQLGMSKPCYDCVKKLKTLPLRKGYIIDEIFYSDENEEIRKIKLNHL